MAINVERADAYFRTRTLGDAWEEYSHVQKSAAIGQAKRDLSRALGRAMQEDETEYTPGDRVRDEYAVYEQAAFSLLCDALPARGGDALSAPLPGVASEQGGGRQLNRAAGVGKWSKEALAWLGCQQFAETVIG